ncbi:DegT/DnrJ/EryC1/StrS family aminotransferase [Siculibacillus lacustris]|uniref:DegT/DnrJ/EryC1/StrS family aminotransferase n=1 Tax=Siculibacillus lacustris TaxID=1549641 RepID=A0A4Q9VNZ8_9HYPH|nr:DegT/DnrJ/EryC1/StrS family aminotransferase [Siculibacillus lacustris]TBW37402.1 DegT/DnrJ/EryC1/StrS family aminotransferase [Siculibacillus lacustris]
MTTPYPLASTTWDDEEAAALERVIASGRYTMGPEVQAFEADFAAHFGSRHAVMVNSGSSANLLAIAAVMYHPDLGLEPGDEVIVPTVSWSTTFYPLHQNRLVMRFVDVDRATLNLDLDLVEAAITPRTRAIFAVNLLGNPCDFARLRKIAAEHSLLLFEDNCESMGATFEGRAAGTFGLFGTFSTFYSHHICTMEGGVVVTDDEKLYHTMLSLRAHGWLREQPAHSHLATDVDDFAGLFRFVLPGFNFRPLEMEGALGRSQLRKLPELVRHRRANAQVFTRAFGDIPGIRLQQETGESSWFGFALILEGPLSGQRRALVEVLRAAGVECRPIVAGNFLANPVMRHLDHSVAGPVPVAEAIDVDGLFIGNHHHPVGDDLERIAEVVRGFAAARA